jgi:tRNA pseudouridine13 synthase
LKKVNPTSATKIAEAVKNLDQFGMPNFFGYQRFGVNGDNYLVGKEIIDGKSKIRDKNKKRLFINSYQSHIFNQWLSERIKFSRVVDSFSKDELPSVLENLGIQLQYPELLQNQPHPFKLLEGDMMLHYPFGKGFALKSEEFEEGVKRFGERDSVPSGILLGKRAKSTTGDSAVFEDKFLEDVRVVDGERRYAWIFPTDVESRYREDDFWFELNFTLPKGSYATTFIEEIAKKSLV